MHIQEDRHSTAAAGETKFTGRDRSIGFVKQGSDVSLDLFAEIFHSIATAPVAKNDGTERPADADASQHTDSAALASEVDDRDRDDDAIQEELTADPVSPYDLLVPLQPVTSDEPVPIANADAPTVEEMPALNDESAAAIVATGEPPAVSVVDAEEARVDQASIEAEATKNEALSAVSIASQAPTPDDPPQTNASVVLSDETQTPIKAKLSATEDLALVPQEGEIPLPTTDSTVANEIASDAEALTASERGESAHDQGDRRQRRSNDVRSDRSHQAASLNDRQDRQDQASQQVAASMSADTSAAAASEAAGGVNPSPSSQSDAIARAVSPAAPSAVIGFAASTAAQPGPTGSTTSSGGGIAGVTGPSQASSGNEPIGTTPSESSRQTQVADRARLVNRIAKAFQRIGVDGGQVRLRMHPEELGGVQLTMQINGRKVSATVTADGEPARQLLQEHLPELRQRLESLGLTVERLEVASRNEGGESGLPNQNQQQNGADFGRSTDQREGLWRRQNALNDVKRDSSAGVPVRTTPSRSFRSDRALDLKV